MGVQGLLGEEVVSTVVAPEQAHITLKELIPIVLASAVWGSEWKGSVGRAGCDNSAVVAILN